MTGNWDASQQCTDTPHSPHHLGRRKTNAMPYYKVVVSNEYESTVSTVPTDRINLSAILSESGASNLELPPFVSPDALVNTIESLFAAHVQQAQAGVYGLGIGRMQMADELVRAANARAEASDKARRKLQRKLDRVLAQVKRHKKKRARQGEESDSSDDLSDESERSTARASSEVRESPLEGWVRGAGSGSLDQSRDVHMQYSIEWSTKESLS